MNVATVTFVSVVISLLLTQKYTASITILPPSEEPGLMGLAALAGIGGEMSSLKRMTRFAGLPGMATASDLTGEILKSRSVATNIIDSLDLRPVFRVKHYEDAYKALHAITKITISPEGIIVVSVTHKNRRLSADIANAFAHSLDKVNKQVSNTMGRRYREFVEQRLGQVEIDLAGAEESLKVFQEQHKTLSLPDEIKSAIDVIGTLKAQTIAKEVRLEALRAYSTTDNPEAVQLKMEIQKMNNAMSRINIGSGVRSSSADFGAGFAMPLTSLPKFGLEMARLMRSLKIQEVLYEILVQQYEQAKIMEAKDTPTVQILDPAVPPDLRSFPSRKKIVLVAFILSLIVGVLMSLGADYSSEFLKSAEHKKEIAGYFEAFRDDIANIGRLLRRRVRP